MKTLKNTGRPKGSRDRNNIFLSDENTKIILKSLVKSRNEYKDDKDFEEIFTKLSSLAINIFGSSEYLRIIGQ